MNQPQQTTSSNGTATFSLVLALLGFCTLGITAIPGLIFGGVAMRQTTRSGQQGHGVATAAVILSLFQILMWALSISLISSAGS